jgi:putative sigma-54 modulation protein
MSMRLMIRGHALASEAVCDHTRRRLGFALGRFADRITSVWVRLADENGPRGGVDKRCRIEVRGTQKWLVLVDDADTDLHAAIDRAADRVARSVVRTLERLRHRGSDTGVWRCARSEP